MELKQHAPIKACTRDAEMVEFAKAPQVTAYFEFIFSSGGSIRNFTSYYYRKYPSRTSGSFWFIVRFIFIIIFYKLFLFILIRRQYIFRQVIMAYRILKKPSNDIALIDLLIFTFENLTYNQVIEHNFQVMHSTAQRIAMFVFWLLLNFYRCLSFLILFESDLCFRQGFISKIMDCSS